MSKIRMADQTYANMRHIKHMYAAWHTHACSVCGMAHTCMRCVINEVCHEWGMWDVWMSLVTHECVTAHIWTRVVTRKCVTYGCDVYAWGMLLLWTRHVKHVSVEVPPAKNLPGRSPGGWHTWWFPRMQGNTCFAKIECKMGGGTAQARPQQISPSSSTAVLDLRQLSLLTGL